MPYKYEAQRRFFNSPAGKKLCFFKKVFRGCKGSGKQLKVILKKQIISLDVKQ